MDVRQISVFLENKPGQLAHLCRIIADAGIDLKALNIAETSDYGVLRIITDKPETTLSVLKKESLICNSTVVVAVRVPDKPGGLAGILDVIAERDISIEYMYSMLGGNGTSSAIMVFQTNENEKVFRNAGLDVLNGQDVGIMEE
ncbi:MAG: ACT domain-containing protein [Spirochaetales bacterium]|nr:ACT domain-containing protein [Spirochaetales bacterium]